jgi:hypothetical protein
LRNKKIQSFRNGNEGDADFRNRATRLRFKQTKLKVRAPSTESGAGSRVTHKKIDTVLAAPALSELMRHVRGRTVAGKSFN